MCNRILILKQKKPGLWNGEADTKMKNKLIFTVLIAVVAALLCAVIAQGNRIHELELIVGDCTQSWSEWAEDAREDNLRLQRLENAMGIEDEIEMPH